MRFLYTCSILVYLAALHLAAYFNPKARKWVAGRRGWRNSLKTIAAQADTKTRIWIHCASLGEFEQGRPLIEGIKKAHPEVFVLLTFFSPSGYEIRKNYPFADAVAYLPGDTPTNAKDFLDLYRPNLTVFVKYEFWFNFLCEIRIRRIPAFLISARFRTSQIFFKPYGSWFRKQLQAYTKIFLQEPLLARVSDYLPIKLQVAGDTRVDRVLQICEEKKEFPEIAAFCEGHKVLVAGSTWPPDEALLASLVKQPCFQGWKLLIAPHDVHVKRVQSLEATIPLSACRHTALLKGEGKNANMLVIDHVGILSSLYRYGDIAYIGGAFGSGLHNTLEPIAFKLPVLFGPKFHKFPEALQLLADGGAFCVKNVPELEAAFSYLTDDKQREHAGQAAYRYIQHNSGATDAILKEIFKILLH